MVFLAEKTIPISTKDILSWTFDQVPYDPDEPVRRHAHTSSRHC